MPKVRDCKDIKVVFDSSDTNLTIKHQTGDAIILCKGGALLFLSHVEVERVRLLVIWLPRDVIKES